MNKALLKMYTDPIPEQSDYATPKKKTKGKRKKKHNEAVPIKSFGGIKVMDMDVHAESKARDSDSSSDEAPVVEVDVADEEHYAYAMRMKKSRERNASRWRELDLDGRVVVKVEDEETVGADLSPPRGGSARDADLSPPRGRTADLSPPRGRTADISVKREPGLDADDLSPPRGGSTRDVDLSPPRGRAGDLSPPRGRTADFSVKREPGIDDLSPPRPRKGQDSDLSPPRGRNAQDDMSPPRTRTDTGDLSPKRKRTDNDGDSDVPRKKFGAMSTGGRAGLFLGDEIAKEEELEKKKRAEELRKMDPKASGQGAATIFRDKRGKILSGLTQMIAQEEGKVYEDASTNYDWGVGKIDRSKEERDKQFEEEEAGRGYHATYKDDVRLNEEKANEDRWDDPMAKLVSKDKASGDKKKKNMTIRVYRGWIPANRYNIRPGWRWDGIDRSNKYEDKIFQMLNEKDAQHVRDMHFAQADM